MTLAEAILVVKLTIAVAGAQTPYDNLSWVPVQDVYCLGLVGYHEMRQFKHDDECELLAMMTVLTRSAYPGWPSDVCTVARQRDQFAPKIKYGASALDDPKAWARSVALAVRAYTTPDLDKTLPVASPTHFHLVGEKPDWAKSGEVRHLKRTCNSDWYRSQ